MEAQAVAPPPPQEPGPSRPALSRVRTAPLRLFADRAARWVVTAGGLAIIASILGILIFIVIEVWPLAGGARVSPGARLDVADHGARAGLTDEYKSHVAALDVDGTLRVHRVGDGKLVLERRLLAPDEAGTVPGLPLTQIAAAPGQQLLTAATRDGRLLAVYMNWDVSFVGDERVITPEPGQPVFFEMDPAQRSVGAFSVRLQDDGRGAAAAQLNDGRLVVATREVEQNLFTEEVTESWDRAELPVSETLSVLQLDQDALNLYGGSAAGAVLWWQLADGRPVSAPVDGTGGAGVTTLSLLIGDRSLIVGRDDGTLAVWFPVRQPDESFRLERIRQFRAQQGAITRVAPSFRDKGFLALDDEDGVGLYYSTSHRVLWTGRSPLDGTRSVFYTPKADGAMFTGPDGLAFVDIHNPHPEVGWRALFGRVWYEGYEQRDHVWQSSSGTDDFEPKLSLTPLLVGTLKGTVYSLFLAIPLGVLGAMYTSQFMHPSLRRLVKPTVEIMAALPSVVLGFLAGLWLAPRVERIFPSLVLMLIVLPLLVLAAGFAWRALPVTLRHRVPAGTEALLHVVVLVIGIGLCLSLNEPFEGLVFGGNFQDWLLGVTGLRYDQRNAVVVGLAMGFAVIPIIFSIAEDAFSNVPRNLVSGSLALGANRWQTVTRVVLPTASPGIFSAIMIGFGRAVGETMIVLMATGNTPVLDWNPFNGFRTLSANIAVEIPEAPHGGTLYRTLFLAALILFVLTFLINTLAELVRQRLRKRYSQL